MGAVIGGQAELLTLLIGFPESKDISHRRAAEAINPLVIVAHDEYISFLAAQKFDQLHLDVIRVLVLIDHHIVDATPKLSKPLGMVRQKLISLGLQVSEVHHMLFPANAVVLHHQPGQHTYLPMHGRAEAPQHILRVDALFQNPRHQPRNISAPSPRGNGKRSIEPLPLERHHLLDARDGVEFLQVVIYEILLLELVGLQIIFGQGGIVAELLQDSPANVVERADVHVMEIHLDTPRGKLIGETGGELLRRLHGVGDQHDFLRPRPLLLDQMHHPLDGGVRLPGPRPGDHQSGPLGRNGPGLLFVCCLFGHVVPPRNFIDKKLLG